MKKIIIFLGIVFLSCSISFAISIGGGSSIGATGTPLYVEKQNIERVLYLGNVVPATNSDDSLPLIWNGNGSGIYTQQVKDGGFQILGGPLVIDTADVTGGNITNVGKIYFSPWTNNYISCTATGFGFYINGLWVGEIQ